MSAFDEGKEDGLNGVTYLNVYPFDSAKYFNYESGYRAGRKEKALAKMSNWPSSRLSKEQARKAIEFLETYTQPIIVDLPKTIDCDAYDEGKHHALTGVDYWNIYEEDSQQFHSYHDGYRAGKYLANLGRKVEDGKS